MFTVLILEDDTEQQKAITKYLKNIIINGFSIQRLHIRKPAILLRPKISICFCLI